MRRILSINFDYASDVANFEYMNLKGEKKSEYLYGASNRTIFDEIVAYIENYLDVIERSTII